MGGLTDLELGNYKPALSEILTETFREIVNDGKNLFDHIGKIGFKSAKRIIIINVTPYIIPSMLRVANEYEFPEDFFKNEKKVGPTLLNITGSAGVIAQALGYYKLAHDGHLEYLLIPVATNIISGIYEKGRKVKKEMIEKHNKLINKT